MCLQGAALTLGSVILVTGLQVTALLFALPIYARMTRQPVSRWEWVWAVVLAGALAVVVTVGNPVAGHSRASLHTWLIVAAVMGPVFGLCLLGARKWPDGAIGAVLLAAVSGASLGLFAVLVKGATEAAEGGIVALLAAPELYASIVAAVAGMVFQQSAYRGGPLNASMPTMTVAKPVVGSFAGHRGARRGAAARRRAGVRSRHRGHSDCDRDCRPGTWRGRDRPGVRRRRRHRTTAGGVGPLTLMAC